MNLVLESHIVTSNDVSTILFTLYNILIIWEKFVQSRKGPKGMFWLRLSGLYLLPKSSLKIWPHFSIKSPKNAKRTSCSRVRSKRVKRTHQIWKKTHTIIMSKMLIYLKFIFVKIIGCSVCYSLLFNDEFRLWWLQKGQLYK